MIKKKQNQRQGSIAPIFLASVYELSMFRVAHLSGADGGECRLVKYATNIMQLSCKEALGFSSLHEAAF